MRIHLVSVKYEFLVDVLNFILEENVLKQESEHYATLEDCNKLINLRISKSKNREHYKDLENSEFLSLYDVTISKDIYKEIYQALRSFDLKNAAYTLCKYFDFTEEEAKLSASYYANEDNSISAGVTVVSNINYQVIYNALLNQKEVDEEELDEDPWNIEFKVIVGNKTFKTQGVMNIINIIPESDKEDYLSLFNPNESKKLNKFKNFLKANGYVKLKTCKIKEA